MCDWERQQGEKRNDGLEKCQKRCITNYYWLTIGTNYMYFAAFSAHYSFWTMVYSSLEEFSRL